MKKITRDEMAFVYAGIISVIDYSHFKILNQKITRRWSRSGLIYIKEKAWKILKQLNVELD